VAQALVPAGSRLFSTLFESGNGRLGAYHTVHLADSPVSFRGAGFSLRRTSVRLPQGFTSSAEWRAEARRRLKRHLQNSVLNPLPHGRGSVSACLSTWFFRAARASKGFLRILQVPLKSAPQLSHQEFPGLFIQSEQCWRQAWPGAVSCLIALPFEDQARTCNSSLGLH
jgi:hypothetical protein